jgi:SOS-response transcriptional repressor LexA
MNKSNNRLGKEARQKIMDFLKREQVTISPVSYREIAEAAGISSTSVVDYHLSILEKQGRIERTGQARHIRVVEKVTNDKPPVTDR